MKSYRNKMRMTILNHFWYALCFMLFLVYINGVLKLNNEPEFDSFLEARTSYPLLVICFKLFVKENNGKCGYLAEKSEFTCKFKYQLGCYTKDFGIIKKSAIRQMVKKCRFEREILVFNDTQIEPEVMIDQQDYLCLKFDHQNFSSLYDGAYQFEFNKSSHHDYYIYFLDSTREKTQKLRRPLFHRKCFLNENNDTFRCRNPDIGFLSNNMIRHKMCKNYKEHLNQFECLQDCYKKYLPLRLTKKTREKCLNEQCPLEDCVQTQYYIDSVAESGDKHAKLWVREISWSTEVYDYIDGETFFVYTVGILGSLFGFNFLHQSLSLYHSLISNAYKIPMLKKSVHRRRIMDSLRYSNKYIRWLFMSIIAFFCFYQLSKSFYRYLQFSQKMMFYYDLNQSMVGEGVTLSACFEIDKIFHNSSECNRTTCTIGQLAQFTKEASELIESVDLKSAGKDQSICTKEVFWFFKDIYKCFDFDFSFGETKLDYYLRTDQIEIRAFQSFDHFLVRNRGHYPTTQIMKQEFAELKIYVEKQIRANVFLNQTCKVYEEEPEIEYPCYCKTSCTEMCTRDSYLKKNEDLSPAFIISRQDLSIEKIATSKFSLTPQLSDIEKIKKDCEKRFIQNCISDIYTDIGLSFGHRKKKALKDILNYDVQVLILTQTSMQKFRLEFSDILYNFINLASLWFGFSLPLVTAFLWRYFDMIKSKVVVQLLKHIILVSLGILFYSHLSMFFEMIDKNEKYPMMYSLESKTNYVPRISVCMIHENLKQSNDENNLLTANEIDRRTASIEELVDRIKFFDFDFNKIILDKSNISKYLYNDTDYMAYSSGDFMKTSINETKLEKMFKIKTFFLNNLKCFDFILTYKYGLIDYRLSGNPPIFELYVNESFESVLVILNDFQTMNLENRHKLDRYENLELSYKRLKIEYTDNLYYFKWPLELFRPRNRLNQTSYFKNLHQEFFDTFQRTTTIIPLLATKHFDTPINNSLFREFYSNKSNYEHALDEQQRLQANFEQRKFVEFIKTMDAKTKRTLFKIYPHFLKYTLIVSNRLTVCELLLNFTLIFSLYFGICFIDLPSFFFRYLFRSYKISLACAKDLSTKLSPK